MNGWTLGAGIVGCLMVGRSLFSSTANTAATSLVGVAVTFALSVVVARTLGPLNKGAYDLMVASATLATLTLGFSLSSGVTFGVARGNVNAHGTPVVALGAGVLLAIVTGLLLATIAPVATAAGFLPPDAGINVIVGIALLAAGTFLASISKAVLIGARRIIAANNAELAGRVVGLTAALLLGVAGAPLTFVAALLSGLLAGAAVQTILIRPRGRLTGAEVRGIVAFSLPSYLSNVLQFLNYRLDLFLIALLRGPAEVGLYALAGTLAQLIWIVPRAIATVIFPTFAAERNSGDAAQQTAKAARFTALISILSSLALGGLAFWLVPTVYGTPFAASTVALWLLLPGAAALAPAAVVAAYFLGMGRPDLNARVSAAALVVTIVFDLLLIPAYGMVGAAVASSLSYGSTLVVTLLLATRLSRMSPALFLIVKPDEISDVLARIVRILRRQ